MDYLQLAYLAEFSAAYNLAFGEFKHDKQAHDLKVQFDELKGILSSLDIHKLEIHKKNNQNNSNQSNNGALTQEVNTPFGDSLVRLWKFINNGQDSVADTTNPVKKYNAWQGFWDRVKIFRWAPQYNLEEDYKNIFSKWFHWLRLHFVALLPSWGFSKTALWMHSPCSISIKIWSAVVMVSVLLVGASNISILSAVLTYLNPFIYGVSGAVFLVFLLRPLCHIVSVCFKAPQRVRAKDYPKALFFIATITVAFITIMGHEEVSLTNIQYWWFFFGMLLISIIYPLLLSVAYELIDARMQEIVKICEINFGKKVSNVVDDKFNTIPPN